MITMPTKTDSRRSGTFFAYAIHERYYPVIISHTCSGSDWNSIKVKNVLTGQDLEEKLEWVKFTSIAWTLDEKVRRAIFLTK